jgi:hypothetical protein
MARLVPDLTKAQQDYVDEWAAKTGRTASQIYIPKALRYPVPYPHKLIVNKFWDRWHAECRCGWSSSDDVRSGRSGWPTWEYAFAHGRAHQLREQRREQERAQA